MKQQSRASLRIALFVFSVGGAAFLGLGCQAQRSWPFAAVEATSPEQVAEIVRARARSITTLWARVQVEVESKRFSGAFDLASIYRRPGALHMVAFKGLLLSSRPIFELTFTETEYRLVLHEENSTTRTTGPGRRFTTDHPDLARLYWLRELLFLAGECLPDARVSRAAAGDPWTMDGQTRDGARVRFALDPKTLGVVTATIEPPDGSGPLEVRYRDYDKLGDVYVPSRVEASSHDRQFSMVGVVTDLEVNVEIDDDIFQAQ